MRNLMRHLFIGGLLFGAALHAEETFNNSVVKIFTTAQNVDYYEPWKPGSQYQLQGCGSIVAGERILTTAHMVNKGNYIEVQKFGETKRYVAKVEQLGFDLDLALLSVEDKEFFEGTKPVVFGEVPQRGDKLLIQGGDELSIKEDSASTMNMAWSTEGARLVPVLLTNGAIESAHDGCPVFAKGKFVGIPFETVGKPDKTGSLIPVNVIQRFYKGFEGGRVYDGFPDLGFYTQDLENPFLRREFKIAPKQSGEIITRIVYHSSADGVLKEGDVLLAIDGNPVDDEGYITLKKVGRVPELYLATFYQMGESISLDILRDGKSLNVKMPLKAMQRLLSCRQDNRHPSYFMKSGFVFVPLTVNYFGTSNWDSIKPELIDLYFHGSPSAQQKEVVLISHVLPHEINKGYDKLSNLIVKSVNGQPIRSLSDVVSAFGKLGAGEASHVIEVDDHNWFGSTIILDAKKADQATAEIMKTFKIPSDRSRDLR